MCIYEYKLWDELGFFFVQIRVSNNSLYYHNHLWLHELLGMAQIASQGNAGQTNGSGVEGHGNQLEFVATFAY